MHLSQMTFDLLGLLVFACTIAVLTEETGFSARNIVLNIGAVGVAMIGCFGLLTPWNESGAGLLMFASAVRTAIQILELGDSRKGW